MTTEKERPRFATNDTPSGKHGKLPYRSRGKLLTEGELRFYRQGLRPAIGDRYFIAPKVRLTDVITLPAELWEAPVGHKISQRHVDFVLCKKRDLAIIAVIELDHANHLEGYRISTSAPRCYRQTSRPFGFPSIEVINQRKSVALLANSLKYYPIKKGVRADAPISMKGGRDSIWLLDIRAPNRKLGFFRGNLIHRGIAYQVPRSSQHCAYALPRYALTTLRAAETVSKKG